MSDMKTGGWTNFTFPVDTEAQNVFIQALEGFTGVSYKAFGVATQVVAGKNYCYICEGVPACKDPSSAAYKLYVYKPLEGTPYISKIVEIEP